MCINKEIAGRKYFSILLNIFGIATVTLIAKLKAMTYRYGDTRLPQIVIIGAGFAGLELVKRLSNTPYRVVLLDKHNYHTFQPLLYQIASAGLTAESIAYPLRRKIGKYPNVIFRVAAVTEVNTDKKEVITDIGNFTYDHLVVATGAVTNFYGNDQLEKLTYTLKSVPEALNMRSAILQQLEEAVNVAKSQQLHPLNFVIVGGGPTGVELAGALAEIRKNVLPSDYRELDPSKMEIHLIEGATRILPTMKEVSSEKAKKYLEDLGVQVWLNAIVKNYDGKQLQLADGKLITADHVIWTAGVKGATIKGLPQTSIGRGNRYLTNRFNQLKGFDNIYVLGDIAMIEGDPDFPNGHPGVAQVAMQQAKQLADNFKRLAKKSAIAPFRYKDLGSMATIGRHRAVVELPFINFGGYVAWFVWMFIHLMALVGFRNRFMVFINWMWNYFMYDRAHRIIIDDAAMKTEINNN